MQFIKVVNFVPSKLIPTDITEKPSVVHTKELAAIFFKYLLLRSLLIYHCMV